MKLNAKTWPSWSKAIASPHDVDEYSPSAIENLMVALDEHIVHVKNVRGQFKDSNNIQVIDFANEAERKYYNDAWERFLSEKAKIEGSMEYGGGSAYTQILAQLTKFRQAAELLRCEYIVDAMYDSVTNHNQAACCAMVYKASISKCVYLLVHKYNVPRSMISLIWGGGASQISAEKKKKMAIKSKLENSSNAMELMEELDIDMEDLGLSSTSEHDADFVKKQNEYLMDESLKLGVQDAKERERNKLRFQKGKSLYCFFTFKAGSQGLNLAHSDEFTKEKCRRKPSGFVFEEDIKLIPTRQRICLVSTTYSENELVQALGRCHRINSLSNTTQLILLYRNTVEMRVAHRVNAKLKCLQKVINTNENWQDLILGNTTSHAETI